MKKDSINAQKRRYARARRLVEKCFGNNGLEIVDAKTPLTLMPSEKDFATAVRHDPHNCGFARTCARLLNATKVLFFKRSVYIDHLGEDGVRRIYRYAPSRAVFNTLKCFDDGKLKASQVLRAFRLQPPSPSNSLIGQRLHRRAWRKTESGRAIEAHRHAGLRVKEINRDIDNTKERLARLEKTVSPKAPSRNEAIEQLERLRKRLQEAVEDWRNKEVIANEVRNPTFNTGTSRPSVRERDANARNGRFFWNPDAVTI